MDILEDSCLDVLSLVFFCMSFHLMFGVMSESSHIINFQSVLY